MSQELFYTSAPKGLKPGSRGFCTVAATAGMPAPLAERLESLSGYRPLFAPGDPSAAMNPVLWAHWRLSVAGKNGSVLSRVCFAGFDYTQRSNKFAHHVFVDAAEQSPAGPAWVMLQPGMMEAQWVGEPRIIPEGRSVPRGDNPPAPCSAWAAVTGDAGWAGVLAEAFVLDSSKPAYLIYRAGTDMLSLLNEAIALLPQRLRWQATFSTYFTDLPAGTSCTWRCCVIETAAAKDAKRLGNNALLLDLTQPLRGIRDGRYVQFARTGEWAGEEPGAVAVVAPGGTQAADQNDYSLPRRQLSQKRPNATQGDEQDQSWMPPFEATVVEATNNAHVHHTGHPTVVFWIIAVTWPLVVAAAVVTYLISVQHIQRTRIDATLQLATVPSTQPSGETVSPLVVSPEGQRDELEAKLKDKDSKIAALIEQQSQTEAKLASMVPRNDYEREVQRAADLEAKLAAKPPVQPPSVPATTPAREAKLQDPLAHVAEKDLPAPADGSSATLLPQANTTNQIGIRFANGSDIAQAGRQGFEETLSLNRDENTGRMEILRTWNPASGFGEAKKIPLAMISFSDGNLLWKWDKMYANDVISKWKDQFQLLSLSLGDVGEGPRLIQFVKIKRLRWNLSQDRLRDCFQSSQSSPLLWGNMSQPEVVGSIDPWSWEFRKNERTRILQFKRADAAFQISYDDSGLLSTTWSVECSARKREMETLQQACDAAEAEVKRLGGELAQLEKQLTNTKPEEKDQLNKAKSALQDQLNTRHTEQSKSGAEFARVSAAIRALEKELPDFQLLLKLNNEVAVTLVVVTTADIGEGPVN